MDLVLQSLMLTKMGHFTQEYVTDTYINTYTYIMMDIQVEREG